MLNDGADWFYIPMEVVREAVKDQQKWYNERAREAEANERLAFGEETMSLWEEEGRKKQIEERIEAERREKFEAIAEKYGIGEWGTPNIEKGAIEGRIRDYVDKKFCDERSFEELLNSQQAQIKQLWESLGTQVEQIDDCVDNDQHQQGQIEAVDKRIDAVEKDFQSEAKKNEELVADMNRMLPRVKAIEASAASLISSNVSTLGAVKALQENAQVFDRSHHRLEETVEGLQKIVDPLVNEKARQGTDLRALTTNVVNTKATIDAVIQTAAVKYAHFHQAVDGIYRRLEELESQNNRIAEDQRYMNSADTSASEDIRQHIAGLIERDGLRAKNFQALASVVEGLVDKQAQMSKDLRWNGPPPSANEDLVARLERVEAELQRSTERIAALENWRKS